MSIFIEKGKTDVEKETKIKLFNAAVTLSRTLPDDHFGVPEPPSQALCGPNRDGTIPQVLPTPSQKDAVA